MTERMSPELDLLEHCSVEDISFALALRVFCADEPFSAGNIKRVRRVVQIYVNQGYIVIRRQGKDGDADVQSWEARGILEDPATWAESADDDHLYLLSLTPAGWDAFVNDSAGFFDRLFGPPGK